MCRPKGSEASGGTGRKQPLRQGAKGERGALEQMKVLQDRGVFAYILMNFQEVNILRMTFPEPQ